MPVPVTVYTLPPGGGDVAIGRFDLTMHDLPSVGSHYWRGRDPFTVKDVDVTTEPATVHLEHDQEWARQIREALPEGYWLDGGRSSTDGRWHFAIVCDGIDQPIGIFLDDSLDGAIAQTVEAAHRRHAAR